MCRVRWIDPTRGKRGQVTRLMASSSSVPDSFVNSQEWTLSRAVPDLRLGIVGSLCSGKSALVHRYLTGSYMQEESPEGGRFKKEIVLDAHSYLLLIRDEGGPPELQVRRPREEGFSTSTVVGGSHSNPLLGAHVEWRVPARSDFAVRSRWTGRRSCYAVVEPYNQARGLVAPPPGLVYFLMYYFEK